MICPCCGEESNDIKNRPRNTSFMDDALNYLLSCLRCYEEDYNYYKDLWTEIDE